MEQLQRGATQTKAKGGAVNGGLSVENNVDPRHVQNRVHALVRGPVTYGTG